MSDEESHGGSGHESHGGGHGGGSHGAAHEEHEEHEGAPEWLISFADNTALMMGFFVILLAMNMGPKGGGVDTSSQGEGGGPTAAELDWAIGVREAFNNPVRMDSTKPGEQAMIRRMRERQSQGQGLEEGPKGQGQRLQAPRLTDHRAITGVINFSANSTELSVQSQSVLRDIADRVRGLKLIVEVRGYASAAEAYIHEDKAMRLSFDRALAAAKFMSREGVDWRQIRLMANGDNDRVQPVAYSPEIHRLNQRVEIVVTNELWDKTQSPAGSSGKSGEFSHKDPAQEKDHKSGQDDTSRPSHP